MAEKYWTEEEVVNLANKEFDGDREKAEFWIIDHDGWLPDEDKEQIKKTIKQVNKGAKSDKPRSERKPKDKDSEKVDFIAKLAPMIEELAENVQIVNVQKEITFNIGNNSYSISLIKHRPSKN